MSVCPICGTQVLWAKSSKGRPEAMDAEPTAEGYIHIEEGFTHVFEDNEDAVGALLSDRWPHDAIRLYEHHYCAPGGEGS